MKKILGSTSLCVMLFMISCSTIITSRSDEMELPAEGLLETNILSEDTYNNFLKSSFLISQGCQISIPKNHPFFKSI